MADFLFIHIHIHILKNGSIPDFVKYIYKIGNNAHCITHTFSNHEPSTSINSDCFPSVPHQCAETCCCNPLSLTTAHSIFHRFVPVSFAAALQFHQHLPFAAWPLISRNSFFFTFAFCFEICLPSSRTLLYAEVSLLTRATASAEPP